MDKALKFRTDGTFKIVQFSDTEYMDDVADLNERTADMMRTVMETEQPDLVVFAGDVIGSLRCSNPEQSFRDAVSTIEAMKVPWVAIFGNHDSEAGITREQLMDIQLSHSYCAAERTAEHVSGVGNYVLRIQGSDERFAAALYFWIAAVILSFLTFMDTIGFAEIKLTGMQHNRRHSRIRTEDNLYLH